jgi:hypothetical protein
LLFAVSPKEDIYNAAAAMAAAKGITAYREGKPDVKFLQSYHGNMK